MIAWLAALILAIPLGLDLYMPVPEDNPITEEKIELGRRLFNDRRLSRDRSIACASCHDPSAPSPTAVRSLLAYTESSDDAMRRR